MKITRRGQVVRFLAITLGASAVFSLGLMLPAPSGAELAPCYGGQLTRFEDGSGVCRQGGAVVQTWPENTFTSPAWDCTRDGNRECGQ